MCNYPLISDILQFSLDNGPGIRTTVFLKGCPLACKWCHNPEAISSNREIAFYSHICIGCGDCVKICPESAASLEDTRRINREKCALCGKCAEECPTEALRVIGDYYSPDKLIEAMRKNYVFISKGGVTFSGGEPTLYMGYLSEVVKKLKYDGIHVAIQTSGFFDISEFEAKILPYIDLIFYDIKLIDSIEHEKYTGKKNEKILRNFLKLMRNPNVEIIPRVPLIPQITTTEKNIKEIARFFRDVKCSNFQLLPYNPGGIEKRVSIGKMPAFSFQEHLMAGVEEEVKKLFQRYCGMSD